MTLIVQSNTTKRLYKTTNICILTFTITWLILCVLQLFDGRTIEILSAFLMLLSAPFFIIGVASSVIVNIIEKTQEISADEVQQLLLNIEQKNYEKGDFCNIKPNDNFIVVRKFTHEINSVEALKLLEIAEDKGIEVQITKHRNYFGIDKNPKHLFKDCMDMLWSASR